VLREMAGSHYVRPFSRNAGEKKAPTDRICGGFHVFTSKYSVFCKSSARRVDKSTPTIYAKLAIAESARRNAVPVIDSEVIDKSGLCRLLKNRLVTYEGNVATVW
jgi:hypothetical protein